MTATEPGEKAVLVPSILTTLYFPSLNNGHTLDHCHLAFAGGLQKSCLSLLIRQKYPNFLFLPKDKKAI